MKSLFKCFKYLTNIIILNCIINSITVNGQCTINPSIDTNLVYNNDFNFGNVGFTSQYGYCPTSGFCMYGDGNYTVYNNPNELHNGFVGSDHTTGTGNFLFVNGHSIPGTSVWNQTINVEPNTDYEFSLWVTSLVNFSLAQLNFRVNNADIGVVFEAPSSLNSWIEFKLIWNSGINTNASISIINQNTQTGGNDFGIDDISFIKVCPVPLPVDFIHISIDIDDYNETILTFNTINEKNITQFFIEGSYDGINFMVFDTISALNISGLNTYSLRIQHSIYSYVRVTENSGMNNNRNSSSVLPINKLLKSAFIMYSESELVLHHLDLENIEEISIYNALGQLLWNEKNIHTNKIIVNINTDYFLIVFKTDTRIVTQRFVL
jgi:hypothetical protein